MTMATDKTLARLSIALRERDVERELAAQISQLIDRGISQTQASTFIGLLETLDRKPQTARVTEPGYYLHPDGRVCKVQRSKKGYLYALEPRPGGQWKFISGLLRELSADAACEAPTPQKATADDIAAAIAAAQSA